MLYFAYGSNMDRTQMRERCAGAQLLCKAMLPDYELQFTRTSKKLNGGVADILPAQGTIVWGVVYHLEAEDRDRLDKKEGVPVGAYRHESITVLADGDLGRRLKVFTYVVCSKESPRPKPTTAYLERLFTGAEDGQLPASYIELLRAVETLPASDSDKAKALARELATRTIKNNPHLWDQLKYQLADCQHVDFYGSPIHTDFLTAVRREDKKLTDTERLLLKTHISPKTAVIAGTTCLDIINGQIFSRAKTAISRM